MNGNDVGDRAAAGGGAGGRRFAGAAAGLLAVGALAPPAVADDPTGPCASTPDGGAPLALVYGGSHDVTRPRGEGSPRELSGLAVQPDDRVASGFWMWLIDDGKRNLYRADVDGYVGRGDDNKIALARSLGRDLEGLTFRVEDDRFYAVQESDYRIIRVDPRGDRRTAAFALAEMAGYDSVTAANDPEAVPLATYLTTGPSSSHGLEGIAYFRGVTAGNQGRGSFFVVKERDPGLLIEIDRDLGAVLGFTILNCGAYLETADCPSCSCPGEAGLLPFTDRVGDGHGAVRDFSGLAYDARRGRLWIASDTSTAVFLYDVGARTYSTFPLTTGGLDECVQQVEGVAYVETLDALNVVSDRRDSARYFHYDVVER